VDRHEIQRHDFPTGRRGYDPAAVDEHLRRVADEFEGLRRPAPPPSLSGGTSEQVRVILEAAERSAEELRARAGDEASAHVTRVREAADGLLGRLDDLEAELNRLLQGLRQSGERLARGLEELQADAARAAGAPPPPVPEEFAGPPRPVPEDDSPPLPEEDFAAAAPPPAADADFPPIPAEEVPAAEPPPDPAPLSAPELPSDDEAGARLIALNMALDGIPREEAARYLAEHFALADPQALLDDVYSRAER
jgi:DivIVA domain-containing protein